ncbi:hypothetical protein FEAC_13330 [Ferrimicrobium acidiphilum DSM 19497]|uniref:Uncharacterized protein n=1 Tax=Ferrimicrobium acidiphilum DSM 19497 TaxID=1121877 RepID=A0A0D8FXK8_9ACTN|nr:hypothetical protein FEAC_13330 [Ferrimicrobium acidiphilum DSM 19497]
MSAGIIGVYALVELVVDLSQGCALWHGNHVAAPGPLNLTLNASLLMGTLDAWGAIGGAKAIVGTKGGEALVLHTVSPDEHLGNRGGEIVIADLCWYPAKGLKCLLVAV